MTYVITALVLAVFVTLYVWKYVDLSLRPIYKDLDALGIGKHLANFRFHYTTDSGIEIKSVVSISPSVALTIEQGILEQIRRHNVAFPGWENYKSLPDYKVLIIEPMATNEVSFPGSPALKASGIQTAGTCIGVWPGSACKKPYIVIPHQADVNWSFVEYLRVTSWYESEHVREYMNDLNVFYQFTNTGDVHPHIP